MTQTLGGTNGQEYFLYQNIETPDIASWLEQRQEKNSTDSTHTLRL